MSSTRLGIFNYYFQVFGLTRQEIESQSGSSTSRLPKEDGSTLTFDYVYMYLCFYLVTLIGRYAQFLLHVYIHTDSLSFSNSSFASLRTFWTSSSFR